MKQISKTVRKDFKMPLIFKDDLQAIENIFEGASVKNFKIKTKDFEFDSISEVDSKLKSTNELSISSYEPYISIDFNKHSAYLYASDSETMTVGVVSKIEEVIKKRERKLRWFSAKLSVWFAGPLFVIVLTVFTKLKDKGVSGSMWYGLTLLLLIVIWWIRDFRHNLNSFSTIVFIERNERKSFFIRKKDEIILVIITAVLTFISTIITQQLFK